MQKDFRINNFDLIRIATAVLVLINHSLSHLELDTPRFYTVIQQFPRVPMFFVMSGFLLSASFERNSNLKTYFTNRLLRIYPGLWVCLLFTIIVFSLVGTVSFLHLEAIPWVITQLLGIIWTPHFLKDFGFGSYNGSLWTIVVELQFYLVLPVLYFVGNVFAKKFIRDKDKANLYFYILFALCFVLAFSLKYYFNDGDNVKDPIEKSIRYSILPHAYIFMMGILMQRWKIWKSDFIFNKGLYWCIGYLAFVYLTPNSDIKNLVQMMILAPCTIAIAYSAPGIATKYLKGRDLSYGVFMYHGMILSVLVEMNMKGSYYYMLIVFVLSMILAYLSYRFVETPAMSLAKKKNKARMPEKSKREEEISTHSQVEIFQGNEQPVPVPQARV
jgi:peptidoglycan/LPS O-acetylase OafA/YrhL